MQLSYVAKRIGMFFLVIWLAATINFFLPRLGGQDPVRQQIISPAALGGSVPTGPGEKVIDIISRALPWTLILLTTTTLISWVLGTMLGAFMGWPRAPKWLSVLVPPLLSLNAIPFFLLGLILIFLFSFRLKIFPLFGGYTAGTFPSASWSFFKDAFWHSVLPALSIILVSLGGWALGMRAMMVTTRGEDYVTYADAKGLEGRTIFSDYAIRNALLPQATGFALSLGTVVTSGVVIETQFGLPGLGSVLGAAISSNDFLVIYGVVLFITIAVATSMVIVELLYPLLDPRIRHA